ncbi:MAG: CoA transferase [Firmicutes bacterium]|nr:CoA transferase [Bacillota bacterium]
MIESLKPLQGVTVVELASFVAAPATARLLADWGANVIKIEPPKGDPMRMMGGLVFMPIDNENENPAYDQMNSGKKGIVINIKDPAGKEVLHKLLQKADIFITNNREDALVRMGFSYDQLKDRYPKLVYGQISGYGEKGPDKDRPGYDFTSYYARGGITGTLYEKGTSPVLTVAAFGDLQVALALSGGLCASLYKAKMTGRGEKVSVSLYSTALYVMEHLICSSQYGKNPYPRSRKDTANPFQAAYPTKDGRWIQGAVNAYDKFYEQICTLMGREDLAHDERYNSFDKVKNNPRPLIEEFDKTFATKTADEWIAIFNEADIPFDKEVLWEEILEDEQAWADDDLCKVDGYPYDERFGTTRTLLRSPQKFLNAGLADYTKGPRIGEHTDEVLKEYAGYTDEELKALKEAGSIQ